MDAMALTVAGAVITICFAALALALTMRRTNHGRLADRHLRAQNRRLRRSRTN